MMTPTRCGHFYATSRFPLLARPLLVPRPASSFRHHSGIMMPVDSGYTQFMSLAGTHCPHSLSRDRSGGGQYRAVSDPLVCARLYRRAGARLALCAAAGAQREALGQCAAAGCERDRRSRSVFGARHRHRRPARPGDLLRVAVLFRAPAGDSRAVERRHVVSRRADRGVLAMWFVARQAKVSILTIGDICAAAAPIGILLGRIANFIRPEEWGRPADAARVPWAMVFPGVDDLPRHPSQLYEAGARRDFAVRRAGVVRARRRAEAAGPDDGDFSGRLRRGAHFLRVLPRARSAAANSSSPG